MEVLKNLFSSGNIVDIVLFTVKPLIILLIFKIVIHIFAKLADGILSKSKLNSGIQGFAKSAVKIVLWVVAIMIGGRGPHQSEDCYQQGRHLPVYLPVSHSFPQG